MSLTYHLTNALIVNEGKTFRGSIEISEGLIQKIACDDEPLPLNPDAEIIDCLGCFVIPGVIDDHVHFREPGLTHKSDIFTESRAAIAGGITSFMEMPNTLPAATTIDILEEKYRIASAKSLANYSFYLGATNENAAEIAKINPKEVCGVKVFMGSSTGNMLVDDSQALEKLFSDSRDLLVAIHSEDENIISENNRLFRLKYGEDVPAQCHSLIRSEEACYRSTAKAVALAQKNNTRLHVLHVSTARELDLFDNALPLAQKRITAEVCLHHLWFSDRDYARWNNLIKVNPSIKTENDREALLHGVLSGVIDVIATDHAPHTLEEKNRTYFKAPSGGPMVQHALVAMLEFYHNGKISIETIVEKMCHAPALCFQIQKRGFIRQGYHADITIINPDLPWKVSKTNILSKCGWSAMEGNIFKSKITHTFVNGNLVFHNGVFNEAGSGKRLLFDR